MHSAILGAGELGTACALALLRNRGDAGLTLFTNDEELSCRTKSAKPEKFKAFKRDSFMIPPKLEIQTLTENSARIRGPLFVCTPSFSLLPPTDPWAKEVLKTAHTDAYYKFLQEWSTNTPDEHQKDRFICVFSRGTSSEGETTTALVESIVRACDKDIPVLCATGPFLSREWAAAEEKKAVSGISLSFAVHGTPPEPQQVAKLQADLEHLFCRENVAFLKEKDSATLLSLCSASALLCAFGAGLVSNVYAGGGGVSALQSYSQNALLATQELVNEVLSRPPGTPLPVWASSVLYLACHSHASKEFIFGRQLDFHFKKNDALRAVFSGATHAHLSATVDGVYSLLKTHHVDSPFLIFLWMRSIRTFEPLRRGSGS
ncbi:hypothetical protein AGDE_08958 [Angomonas deanei]|nr:hypothetical protein AGDE_08958 [Angomonas deanei]|eukprot:EPY31625.1 hypothetical protein AGDE_08958 [Angomonas deanei]